MLTGRRLTRSLYCSVSREASQQRGFGADVGWVWAWMDAWRSAQRDARSKMIDVGAAASVGTTCGRSSALETVD